MSSSDGQRSFRRNIRRAFDSSTTFFIPFEEAPTELHGEMGQWLQWQHTRAAFWLHNSEGVDGANDISYEITCR